MQSESESAQKSTPFISSPLIWVGIAAEGFGALLWTVWRPSEAGSAIFLSLSIFRWLLVLGIFVASTFFLFVGLSFRLAPKYWQQLHRRASLLLAHPVLIYYLVEFVLIVVSILIVAFTLSTRVNIVISSVLQAIMIRSAGAVVWFLLALVEIGLSQVREIWPDLRRLAGEDQARCWKRAASTATMLLWVLISGLAIARSSGLELRFSSAAVSIPLILIAGLWVILALQLSLEGRSHLAFALWAIFLLVFGGLLWGNFLNWGRGDLVYSDWAGITMPRIFLLQSSVRQGVLPFHSATTAMFSKLTDRALAIPDMLFTPQLILLRWMNPGPFIAWNVILLYGIGFLGLLRFRHTQRLSAIAFTILFILFDFNGHIVAHLSVGHLTWASYFLLPWLLVEIFALMQGKVGWSWVFRICLWMLILLLNGGYHQFVYFLFALAFLVLVRPDQVKMILAAFAGSILSGAIRFLPLAVNAGNLSRLEYLAGYPYGKTIFDELLTPAAPGPLINFDGATGVIGAWEATFYLGAVLTVFLIVFGVIVAIRNRRRADSPVGLLIPVLGLSLLSMDRIFSFLMSWISLPPLTGERVPARIFSIALVLLVGISVVEYQRWLEDAKEDRLIILGSIGMVMLGANDLWVNFSGWAVSEAARHFKPLPFDPASALLKSYPDPVYVSTFWVGAVVSAIALAGLGYLAWRNRPQVTAKVPENRTIHSSSPFTP